MVLTMRQLNRATLDRQLLLRRQPIPVADAVRRVVALQAQSPASPYVALWNRVEDFDPAGLDAAFVDRTVVKASLMRLTLHAVYGEDHPVFHRALLPRLRSAYFGDTGLSGAGLRIDDADALVPELLAFAAEPRSVAELEAWLDERVGPTLPPGSWGPLKAIAPLHHAPTGGPWSFGHHPSFVAAGTVSDHDPEVALQQLVRRYLQGFGPASVADIAQFTIVQRSRVRAALEAVADTLVVLDGPPGGPWYDVPEASRPDEDVAAPPRLMAMWDSVLLAHADRSRLIPPEHRATVIRRNGDVLPTLLVDGEVRGVWRHVDGAIEATAFDALDDDTWAALDGEARGLLTVLADRDPAVYGRYRHWWAKLPAQEVRMLGA